MSKLMGLAPVLRGLMTLGAALSAGCGLFEECGYGYYCEGDELWWCDGAHHFGCDEWMEKDCSAVGQVCRADHSTAACFYPEPKCAEQGICEGDVYYDCNTSVGLAVTREDCAETDRVCRAFEDDHGENAGCFYEGVVCGADEDVTFDYAFCLDDIAYLCRVDAKLAYDRKDCGEMAMGCVEYGERRATCSAPCDVEGEHSCDMNANRTIFCSDGYWMPEHECERGRECVLLESSDTGAGPGCVEAGCMDTEWSNASYCEDDVWVFECGGERVETLCNEGCKTIAEMDAGDRVLCEQGTDG